MSTAKIELAGTETFSASPEQVFDLLTDLDELPRHIPDLESSRRVDDTTLACVVRPGFSFMRGKLNLTIRLLDKQRPESAKLETQMSGIGQSMKAESTIALRRVEGGCQLDWQVRVLELKGLISTVSTGLIKAAAERIVTDSYGRLKEKLAKTS